ncbi:MAG: hypothetical protein WCB44_14485, partial [Stellaceae bacterium]
ALTSIVPDLPCLLVMVCILAKDPVIAHHPHTMTIRLSGFCRTSRTLPPLDGGTVAQLALSVT